MSKKHPLIEWLTEQTVNGEGIPDYIAEDMVNKAAERPCELCEKKRKGRLIGMFIPDNSSEFGGRKTKQRFLFYTMCPKCMKKDDAQSKVEDGFKKKLGLPPISVAR